MTSAQLQVQCVVGREYRALAGLPTVALLSHRAGGNCSVELPQLLGRDLPAAGTERDRLCPTGSLPLVRRDAPVKSPAVFSSHPAFGRGITSS